MVVLVEMAVEAGREVACEAEDAEVVVDAVRLPAQQLPRRVHPVEHRLRAPFARPSRTVRSSLPL